MENKELMPVPVCQWFYTQFALLLGVKMLSKLDNSFSNMNKEIPKEY